MLLLLNKIIISLLLCLGFIHLFSFSVYAAEANDIVMGDFARESGIEETEIEEIEYSDDYLLDLIAMSEDHSFSSSLLSSYNSKLYQSESIKDLGALQLSTGFDRERLTTFASTKSIIGVGKEETLVKLHVFHIDPNLEDSLISTQKSRISIGKSGLYNETVCFDYVGINYVLITARDPVTYTTTKRLYKVTLKELETRNKLENMTIDFFDKEVESPSIEGFVPEIVDLGF